MRLTRYIVIFFASTCSLLCVFAAINIAIDTENVYYAPSHPEFYTAYVHRLLDASQGLVEVTPERSVKMRLARLADADCMLVGSSQEMQIDLTTMPMLSADCVSIANVAVSGGSYEDFLSIAAIIARNPSVRRLYIGLHPWSFRREIDKRWTEEGDAYREARDFFGFPPRGNSSFERISKLRNLINGAYLRTNLVELRDKGFVAVSPLAIKPATVATNAQGLYYRTGRYQYSRDYLARAPFPVDKREAGDHKIVAQFADPDVETEFEMVLDRLHKVHHIDVSFLLLPYHPLVFECVKRLVCDVIEAMEARVRSLAKRRDIAVIGSYAPQPSGFQAKDFLDESHLATTSLMRLKS